MKTALMILATAVLVTVGMIGGIMLADRWAGAPWPAAAEFYCAQTRLLKGDQAYLDCLDSHLLP
jgi:hypothetical protein